MSSHTKIYWQHPESESCGWVESDRMAGIIGQSPYVDTYISEELYNKRVEEGYHVNPPVDNWLLSEEDRKLLWEHYLSLKAKLDRLGAMVQNDGVCMQSASHEMKLLGEGLRDGVTEFIILAHRVPEKVR